MIHNISGNLLGPKFIQEVNPIHVPGWYRVTDEAGQRAWGFFVFKRGKPVLRRVVNGAKER